ncbi:hypothetical protein [Acidovorax sp. Leaf73]|uniref:hypothetical protein n=1 Tax=Acidovorax sp. Leaf73 TaxID=2876566 RepID=UPI001E340614|nr:hypothetical protein [Acidovorax sp. Leaf73]
MSARRGYTVRCVCSFPGCKETSFYHYDTQRELCEGTAAAQQRAGKWLCVRHTSPAEVLAENNPTTSHVLVNVELEHGRFWRQEGHEQVGGSGFVFGNGYKAYAKDFPPGTRLTITAKLELPSQQGEPHE